MESTYHDVPLHCTARWLSSGKVLLRFVEYVVDIRTFLRGQCQAYRELDDEKWIVKLMFLADITTHLNKLSVRLQDLGQIVIDLFETRKGFLAKLDVQCTVA